MTTNETKTQTYENLKQISAVVAEETGSSALISDVRNSKKQLDQILTKIKDQAELFRTQHLAEEAAESAESENFESVSIPESEGGIMTESVAEVTPAATPVPETKSEPVPEEMPEPAVKAEPVKESSEKKEIPSETASAKETPKETPAEPEKPSETAAKLPVAETAESAPKAEIKAESVRDIAEKKGVSAETASAKEKPAKAVAQAPVESVPKAEPAAEAKEPEKPVKKKIIIESVVREHQERLARAELAKQRKLDPNFGRTPRPQGPGAGAAPGGQNINSRFINNNTRVKRDGFMSDMDKRPPFGSRPPFDPNRRPGGPRPPMAGGKFTAPAVVVDKNSASALKKKTPEKNYEADKKMSKKALINRGFITTNNTDLEERMGSKKFKTKRKSEEKIDDQVKVEKAIVNTDVIPLKVLSDKLGITATVITKKLFKEGIIKTINESVDFDTAAFVAADLGIELELKMDKSAEEILSDVFVEDNTFLIKRPPVVTVMGHVDHGKTSLLDAIRKTSVTTGEAGGITQHIGAYQVKCGGDLITFIDTPGHEAFTAMRARGAQVTDIAILVVAADDGVMPQTIEAINHAKAAKVPIIVAINKMDKPSANVDRIKQQLADQGILPEEWGGEAIMVPVSAHSGMGIDKLLESILLVADVLDLKANPRNQAKGTIVEAKLDKGKGPVATVLIQNGTLHVGDHIISGTAAGRVRAMLDDKGRNVKEAAPSSAVAILGFSEVPEAGESVFAVESNLSRQVLEERIAKIKNDKIKTDTKVTLEEVLSMTAEGQVKGLNLIIKADVQGSVEAVKQAILKLSNEEVKVNVVHSGVGAITESDVTLANAASAIVIGFNVRPDTNAKNLAERDRVDVRLYRIIYEAIDDIEAALKGMLAPKYKEVILGHAEVRSAFKITGVGMVAGSYVTDGKMVRSCKIRLIREGVVVRDGDINALKRFKDDVKEVATGFECGISLEDFNDIKEGDRIECYNMEIIPQ